VRGLWRGREGGSGLVESLGDSNRSPFRDTEINLDGYSYQSRAAPEASNRSARTGRPARPFGEEVRSESPPTKPGSQRGKERGTSQLSVSVCLSDEPSCKFAMIIKVLKKYVEP